MLHVLSTLAADRYRAQILMILLKWGRTMKNNVSLFLVAVAMSLAACGGGDSGTLPAPSPAAATTPPPAPGSPPVLGNPGAVAPAMAMFDSIAAHQRLVASPLVFTVGDAEWTVMMPSGACALGEGSVQVALDGTPPANLTQLPLGNHTYTATFVNCLVDGLVGTTLTGTATAAYSRSSDESLTATVASAGMRGTGTLTQFSSLADLNAAGSANWTLAKTSTGTTATYAPHAGATLVNNLTGRILTFESGRYSVAVNFNPYFIQSQYDQLAFNINGLKYTLNGGITRTYVNGVVTGGSGEVQIIDTDGRVVVGKIVVDGSVMRVELYDPIIQF
jgi:hypothetical protein